MIVRDAAHMLPRCLGSFQGVADEICVLDTGSKDDSIDIARSYGARVEESPWPGRFDIAVNEAFKLVSADWIFRLDADEWLVEGTARDLRQGLAECETDYAMIHRRDLDSGGNWSEAEILRLYRRSSNPVIVGPIHENVDPKLVQAQGATLLPLAVWHDGYVGEIQTEKSIRNLPILQGWFEQGDAPYAIKVELARTLDQLGREIPHTLAAEVSSYILERIQEDELPDAAVPDAICLLLSHVGPADFRSAFVGDLLRAATGWCWRNPAVLNAVGQMEVKRGDTRAAYAAWSDALGLIERNDYHVYSTFKRSVLEPAVRRNLAIAALELGKFDVARSQAAWFEANVPGDPIARQLRQATASR